MKPTVLICLALFVACVVCAQNSDEPADADQQQQQQPKNAEEFAAMYKKMLAKKRKQQQDAVLRMVQMNESKKEKEVVGLVMKKIFETLVASLQNLAKLTKGSNELRFDKETINGKLFEEINSF
jgi:hypothetical protein